MFSTLHQQTALGLTTQVTGGVNWQVRQINHSKPSGDRRFHFHIGVTYHL